ncbi:hypothetical protein A3K72_01295 [Candidatus Woesearchaeota archaeon RBG_13_36_6]|nr:MAG: hypothetical protein A3K72_01295 [Candidatus Woesearchaeota archaeon RBG_13_36_6]
MKVIIPAAGYATRLYPLTMNKPKHLLDVKGKPIIEHIIKKIEELNAVDEIFIITNEKFYSNFKGWSKKFSSKVTIKIFNDGTTSNDDRLGSIGDIKFVLDKTKLDDNLLVVAGDNLFNFSLKEVYDFFIDKKTNINALYDIKSFEDARQLGVATINKEGKIIEFKEKPQFPKSTLVSPAIYLFPRHKVNLISKYIKEDNNPDKIGYFMEWLLANDELYGYVYEEKWFDIGWPSSLDQARKEFKG